MMGDTVHPSKWCISYQQLLEIQELALQTFGREAYKTATMRDICTRIIIPQCRETETSYALSLNPQGLPIDSFVTHSWDGYFASFVQAIQNVFQTSIQKPNLWICSFALHQLHIDEQLAEDQPLEASPFVQALEQAKTFCVVRNSNTDLYSRIWCVCEVMFATQQGLYPTQTHVTGPNVFASLQTSCLEARASKMEDKNRILKVLLEEYDKEEIDRIVRVFRTHDTPIQLSDEHKTINLQSILHPLSTLDEDLIAEHLVRLLPGTRAWALEAFDRWLLDNQAKAGPAVHRVFVLTGPAGIGKTGIVCKIIHERRKQMLAFHFCRHDDARRSDPKGMLLSLIYQMSCRLPQYRLLVEEILQTKELTRDMLLKDYSVLSLFDELIKIPLAKVSAPDQSKGHYVIVIDALDECADDEGKNEMLVCIQRHFQKLPIWIKFFMTTRPEVPIVERLKKFHPIMIEPEEDHNQHDLALFFQSLLQEFGSESLRLGGSEHDAAVAALTKKAEGLFIFASYLGDMVGNEVGTIETLQLLDNFPSGLEEFYEMQLERVLSGTNTLEWKIVEVITAAREPLHVELIQHLLQCSRSERVSAFRVLSSFFPIDNNRKVRVSHKSLTDWLVAGEREDAEFFVDIPQVHRSMGARCLDLLSQGLGIAAGAALQSSNASNHASHQETTDYALRHCVFHLCAGGMLPQAQSLLLDIGWLMAKAKRGSTIRELVADFEMAKRNDRVLHLVGRAVGLSLNAIRRDPRQLPGQLVGRLLSATETINGDPAKDGVFMFLNKLKRYNFGFEWFCPILPTWDQATDPCICVLEGHRREVLCLATSFDGSRVASGSEDCVARIWNAATGECQLALTGHTQRINAVVWSGSHHVITASDDKTIRVWNGETGECEATLSDSIAATCLDVSSHSRLVSAHSKQIKVWDAREGHVDLVLAHHNQPIRCLSLLAVGQLLASSADDSNIIISSIADGACIRSIKGNGSRFSSVKWSNDGRLASSSMDGWVQVWDQEGTKIMEQSHDIPLVCVSWSPDGLSLATAGASVGNFKGEILAWDLQNNQIDRLAMHQGSKVALSWTVDNKIVSAVKGETKSKDYCIRIWNPAIQNKSFESRALFDLPECSCWSPNGSTIAFGFQVGLIRLFDSATGDWGRVLEEHSSRVSHLSFSNDGNCIASSSWDETIKVWNVQTEKCVCTLNDHTSMVQKVQWSYDGTMLASSSYDMTIRIWCTRTWKCKKVFRIGSEGSTLVLIWNYDDLHVISGDENGTIHIVNVVQETCRKINTGHHRILCLACSHDGKKVVSGLGYVCVWELATGCLLSKFKGHDLLVHHILWSRDDSKLLLHRRSREGSVYIEGLTVCDANSGVYLDSVEKCDNIPEDFDPVEAATIVRARSTRKDPLNISCRAVSVFGKTACAMLDSGKIKFFTRQSIKA